MDNLDAFDDHPSLSASLEDFEHHDRSPTFALPSQHSGFKSDESEPDAESNSEGPWSPPAWRRKCAAPGWYRHQPYAQDNLQPNSKTSQSRSRETSPKYESAQEDDADITIPAKIPLPRGSMSPTKERSPSPELFPDGGGDFDQTFKNGEQTAQAEQTAQPATVSDNSNNCMCMHLK